MNDPSALSTALRMALAIAVLAAGWRIGGAFGLVIASPLFAYLLARPIFDLAAGAKHSAKALALRSVDGVYYSFRGASVAVWEDEDEQRWLAVASVRAVLPSFPREAVLRRVFPSGVALGARGVGPAVRADELIDFLARAHQADAVKFKNWLQRDVYFPSGGAKKAGATPTSALSAPQGEKAT